MTRSSANVIPALLMLTLLLAALAGTLVGCDRNIEAFDPDEQVSAPDLARIFPPAEAGEDQMGSGAGANSAGARGNLPPSRAEAAGAPAATNGEPVRGSVEVAPEFASQVPADAVLFLMARPAGVTGGPPLAVVRIAGPSFPVAFELGPQNVMMQGMSFSGQMDISARLDRDGNAMTRDDADLVGALGGPVFPGSSGIRLVLDGTHAAGAGAAAAAPVRAATGGGSISGTVTLAASLAAGAPTSGTLFLYARKPGVQRGPPIAVLRVPQPSFPLVFELGPDNVMIPSMSFSGEMSLSARLDGDGNAMSRNPGDVQGQVDGTVTPGISGVALVLDEQL